MFNQPEESPGYVLWTLSNAWQREVRKALKPYKLTHVQFVLLACLLWMESHGDASPTQSALAQRAGVDVMTVSDVLRTLQKGDLVERKVRPSDPRALSVSLTDFGRAMANQVLPVVEDVDRKFFKENGARFRVLVELTEGS